MNNLTLAKPNKHKASLTLMSLLVLCSLAESGSTIADTLLKNNVVAVTSNFSNFDGVKLSIDVPSYPMSGQYRFLKIFDTAGNVLFLGAVSANDIFEVPVAKLKSAGDLSIELFSESAADQTISISTSVNP